MANIKKGIRKLKKEQERIKQYFTETEIKKRSNDVDIESEVIKRLKTSVFALPAEPQEQYFMPDDITALHFRDIGKLLNTISKWCEYYSFETTRADIAKNIAKNRYKHLRSLRLLSRDCQSFGNAVADRESYAETSKEVIEAQNEYDLAKALYQAKHSLYNSALKYFEVVSREQTRRQKEMEFYGKKVRK